MTDAHALLDEFLCFAIHSTTHAINRATKPVLDELGLPYPQCLVMTVLRAETDRRSAASVRSCSWNPASSPQRR